LALDVTWLAFETETETETGNHKPQAASCHWYRLLKQQLQLQVMLVN
jgi:hypothetical protein